MYTSIMFVNILFLRVRHNIRPKTREIITINIITFPYRHCIVEILNMSVYMIVQRPQTFYNRVNMKKLGEKAHIDKNNQDI